MASALLRVHRVLIGFALALAVVLVVWGAIHGPGRGQSAGWVALGLGAVALPLGGLYLRKIIIRPPIR